MGIITISRGSYSRGIEIAKKLSQKLEYDCISRETLLKASKEFNVPEVDLLHANQDTNSYLDHLSNGEKKYTAFIREAFLECVQKDNVVYDGFEAPIFTKDIPNILKVRINANIDYRIKVVMEREDVTEEKARKLLYNIDSERKKWNMYLYGIDPTATELYDIVLHIDNLQVDDAVEFLCEISKYPCFQSTPDSQKKLKELLLAAKAYTSNSTQ